MTFSVALVALSSLVCGVALWALAQAHRIRREIQAKAKTKETDRPKTLSALGDGLDALQIQLREVDTKVETALSLGRSNRSRITNLQHRGNGTREEPADESASPPVRVPVRLPGRVN